MEQSKIVVGRTKYGKDFIGTAGFEGTVFEVFEVFDIPTPDGITPILKPWRSIVFTRDDDKKRLSYEITKEEILYCTPIDEYRMSAGDDIINILIESYMILEKMGKEDDTHIS